MSRKWYSAEEIVNKLRQAEVRTQVREILRKRGVAEKTFSRWKKKFGGMDVTQIRRLKQLEEENRKLKQLANLILSLHFFGLWCAYRFNRNQHGPWTPPRSLLGSPSQL